MNQLLITQSQALRIILGMLTAVIMFHILIIISVIPYDLVWGGRLKSVNEMYVLECASIFVNILLLIVLLLKGNVIKHEINDKILNGILWFFVLLFALNTVGNLLANSIFEKAVFTPLTLILSILIWIIVRKTSSTNPWNKVPIFKNPDHHDNG